jgi:uncharacterized membrane protein
MSRDKIVEICKKVYDYLLAKGWNSTLVKVIVGAAFGIACAYLLSSCSVSYKYNGVEYQGGLLTPIIVEGDKK